MKLVIVESPAKAKTITKYLEDVTGTSGEFVVKASIGHVRDLPKSNKKAIDIEGGFIPHYEISKGKQDVVAELKKLGAASDKIYLATDLDREGEAIAWHIKEICGFPKAKTQRIVFNEITREAIKEALEHPRDIDENLKEAQEARRVLDRLVGYDLSGIIWKKVRYGLSAGRVQSPALRILMEREREIRAFIPETYWKLFADFESAKGNFKTECVEEPRDKKLVEKILELGKSATWTVKDVVETEAKRSARAPFTTSTLQQTASSRLGFSPSRTMMAAQKLYEAGHITYMRTDSTNLSQSALGLIKTTITKEFGADLHESHQYKANSKNAQEAHEAIRPTNPAKKSLGATDDQKKVYSLIWSRAVASQMKDAKMLRTRIEAGADKDIPLFTVTGSRTLFKGWLLADPESAGDDVELPKVAVGEKLTLIDITSEEKQTEPLPRYTEAGLIKELEKRGIGRPSTYASIMRTLEERGYVEKVARSLKPTATGEVVSGFLEEHFPTYISDTFTADMEDKLDQIALGKEQYTATLSDFYGPFSKAVASKEKVDKATNLGDADPQFICPVCSGPMVIKLSRAGTFLSCKRFPDCDGALTIEGKPLPKSDEPIATDPETGKQIYVKTGRFGPYVQLGERAKGKGSTKMPRPKMASIPKEIDPSTVTLEIAKKLLSLPRVLGVHPISGKEISANRGRFGPYIVHEGDFRSLKGVDNPFDITLDRALDILKEEKKKRGFAKKKKVEEK